MSLTDHLVATGSHAGLPFRRDCPACRAERLAGRLPSASVAPGRATAAVVAGTLAAGGLAPAAAAAAPPGAVDQVTGVRAGPRHRSRPGPRTPSRRLRARPSRPRPHPSPTRSVRLDPGPARLGPDPLGLGPGAGPLRAGPAADSGSGARPRAQALAGVTRSGCRRRLGRPRASGPGDRAQGAGARNGQALPAARPAGSGARRPDRERVEVHRAPERLALDDRGAHARQARDGRPDSEARRSNLATSTPSGSARGIRASSCPASVCSCLGTDLAP